VKEFGEARPRRVLYGSLAALLGNLITIFGQIVLVPLFLQGWGSELYGEWLTLYAAAGYMSLLDFGMQMYVINRLNQSYATQKLDEYTRVLHSALLLSLSICATVVCIAGIVLPRIPLEKWFHFTMTSHSVAAGVVFLLTLQIIAKIPCALLSGLYHTVGEFPKGTMIVNFQQLGYFAATALAVLLQGGFAAVALIQLVPLVAFAAYVLWDMRRRHPEIQFGFAQADLKVGLTFLGPSLLYFLMQISTVIVFSGSTLIVAVALGPATVTVFSILRTLTNLTRQIPVSIHRALWPELTSLEAQGQYGALQTIHILVVKIGLLLTLCLAVIIDFSGRDVVALWTQGRVVYESRLTDVLLLFIVFQIIWQTSGVFQAAFNRPLIPGVCSIASAVAGLGLAWLLTGRYGAVGIVLGLFIGEFLIYGLAVPLKTCRILGQNVTTFFYEVALKGLPVVVVVYLFAFWLSRVFSDARPILAFLLLGSLVPVLGVSVGYFFWLDSRERLRLASYATGVWSRISLFN
jgi:O-antigen/teichoic acid export membrane protein